MNNPPWLEERKAACRACDLNVKFLGVRICKPVAAEDEHGNLKKGCGCVLSVKVRLAGQSCPLGKWGPQAGKKKPVPEHALNLGAGSEKPGHG